MIHCLESQGYVVSWSLCGESWLTKAMPVTTTVASEVTCQECLAVLTEQALGAQDNGKEPKGQKGP